MNKLDLSIYLVHAAYWSSFGITLIVLRSLERKAAGASGPAPVAKEEKTAPFSRALLAFHIFAFFTMYSGIGYAVMRGRVPVWFGPTAGWLDRHRLWRCADGLD